MKALPACYHHIEACVDAVIARVGKRMVIATPLGIGKPNQLLNAFYRKACSDPGLELKIMTELSLEKPQGTDDLQRRFLTPFVERHFADYPELDYVQALRSGAMPSNIEVNEFFLNPGRFLGVDLAQQRYVSSNYTHVGRDLMDHGVNVLALPDARSILMLKSTRCERGLESNILWSYGHVTIPRHLRDIVVTEYGIADLRGKSDEDVIAALLNIADSRFQPALVGKAKRSGKLPKHYQIPAQHRNNTPGRLEDLRRILKQEGAFPLFPYGTDLAEDEITLLQVLRRLKRATCTKSGFLHTFFKALTHAGTPVSARPYLKRLGLDDPRSWRERLAARLVVSELQRLQASGD